MKSNYIVITCGESGIDVEQLEKNELQERITPDEDGSLYYGDVEFLKDIPNADKGYFIGVSGYKTQVVIIKGEIITPIPKKVVTEYELGDGED